MKKYLISDVDVSEYLWNNCNKHEPTLLRIDRTVCAIDSKPFFDRHPPGENSGCSWTFLAKRDGSQTTHDDASFVVGEDERWRIALSYRGPFITALSWRDIDNREDVVTSPVLVDMVKKLAQDLGLTYLDAHELRDLEIPWDELQNDAEMRLDWSEMPTAFNLLFYEY